MKLAADSFTKNELVSVKSMILPPMFTFNVLKLVQMMLNPKTSPQEITWQTIKKDMLSSCDALSRKCDNIKFAELEEEDVEMIENHFQETFKNLGNNILGKS